MRSTAKEIKERKEHILLLLSNSFNQSLSVQELAEYFDVSKMTIRRDLGDLENLKLLKRYHGGATLNGSEAPEKSTTNLYAEKIKQSIAKEAAKFVDNHSTIFINSSSTALHTLDYLTDHEIIIVSNNLQIYEKEVNSLSTVIIPGGEVRFPRKILVGDLTINTINNIRANMAIIGCSGINVTSGISTNNFHEAKINEYMINNTNGKIVLVADSTKIGKDTNFIVTDLSAVDYLITDTYADTNIINQIENLGITVIQANLDSV